MNASKYCKSRGLKSLTQLSELTGVSTQTLSNWYDHRRVALEYLVRSARIELGIDSVQETSNRSLDVQTAEKINAIFSLRCEMNEYEMTTIETVLALTKLAKEAGFTSTAERVQKYCLHMPLEEYGKKVVNEFKRDSNWMNNLKYEKI